MKKPHLFVPMAVISGLLWSCVHPASKYDYPMTAQSDVTDQYFGHTVADPYRWLEDDQSAETAEWVKQQNAVTFKYLESIPFRSGIRERLTQIWNFKRIGAPFKSGGKYLISKNDGLQNQSVFYIMDQPGGEQRLALDPNKLSSDGTVSLSTLALSTDGNYLGYSISRGGSDWNELFVRDLSTGTDLPDHLEWIKFSSIAWHGNGFFYNRYPKPDKGEELKGANSNSRIYYHKLGDKQSADVLVYEDNEHPQWSFGCSVTSDEKLLIINPSESTSGNALYFKRLDVANSSVVKIVEGFEDDYDVVAHADGWLYVNTNCDAPKYRVVKIDTRHPQRNNWVTVVAESESDVLSSVSYVGNSLICNYMRDAHSVVKVFDSEGAFLHEVNLPTLGSVGGFAGGQNDSVTFYSFSSYTYPSVVYKYNIAKNESQLYSKTDIDFDFDSYETKQLFFNSKDGTRIPMFVVSKKGIQLDGSNPLWLYGYGGFNASLNPGFDVRRLVWLENGGVYVVANIRGGGEYGAQWHKAGTLLDKQNVFDDFISAARFLIEEKYTNPSKIVVQGGSNGGLLVGVVINQAPELFRVALPAVGVMDMLRYHKFTIGRFWATDYGTSEDSQEMFQYLHGYSPLHNINGQANYPAVLVTTADHDDRVVPAHSFKYIATLQEKYKGTNPVMIRIESQAGHGAGMPVSKMIEEWTDLYSFSFDQLGINPLEQK